MGAQELRVGDHVFITSWSLPLTGRLVEHVGRRWVVELDQPFSGSSHLSVSPRKLTKVP